MDELLVILVPREMHEDMVDALMSLQAVSGFTASAVSGFSREHSRLSLAEQVEGSRRISRFEVLHEPALRQALLEALAPVAGRDSLRYWVQPVLESGHIGS
ncbi:MAG: DUF3240 family protein [Haliea sp.]|uniref:DUF3240 family protein n=1 Tax=Haliea sp. TaxID=1932666 RepID=UPI0032EDBBEF